MGYVKIEQGRTLGASAELRLIAGYMKQVTWLASTFERSLQGTAEMVQRGPCNIKI